MTTFVYETTIRVEVAMADDGEKGTEGYETETLKWESPEAQEESAREWANQAMPLHETYEEPWVKIEVPELTLVETRR